MFLALRVVLIYGVYVYVIVCSVIVCGIHIATYLTQTMVPSRVGMTKYLGRADEARRPSTGRSNDDENKAPPE